MRSKIGLERLMRPPPPVSGVAPLHPNPDASGTALTQFLAGLRPLLDDPELTELCINRPHEAFVERRSGWTRVPLPFASTKDSSPIAIAIRLERPERSQVPATGDPLVHLGRVGSCGASLLVLVQLTVHEAAPVAEVVVQFDWIVPPSV